MIAGAMLFVLACFVAGFVVGMLCKRGAYASIQLALGAACAGMFLGIWGVLAIEFILAHRPIAAARTAFIRSA